MRRKTLIALVVAGSLVAGFLGYGWWTRRGPIEFARGGAFGVTPTAEPGDMSSTPGRSAASPSASSKPSSRATAGPTTSARNRPAATRAQRPGVLAPPVPGSYVFDGTGRENVRFGPASACGWDIGRVDMVAKRDAGDTVLDWVWSDNRQQRGIYEIGARGMLHRYYGAVATCLGVRRTEEGTYTPPSVRLPGRVEVGVTWRSTSTSAGWTERMTGEVVRRERVRVPAGEFDTYVVRMRVTFSDGQSGDFDATMWYAPSIGFWVKERAHTDIRASGADFTSDYTIELAEYPR